MTRVMLSGLKATKDVCFVQIGFEQKPNHFISTFFHFIFTVNQATVLRGCLHELG